MLFALLAVACLADQAVQCTTENVPGKQIYLFNKCLTITIDDNPNYVKLDPLPNTTTKVTAHIFADVECERDSPAGDQEFDLTALEGDCAVAALPTESIQHVTSTDNKCTGAAEAGQYELFEFT